jgi:transposase
MTAVLGYSRRIYCRAFLAERQDDWLEGLDGAFQHFGGLTEQVLCDNASPLVKSHDRESGHVVFNPGFEAFCRDRGLTPKACRPRRARTKGYASSCTSFVFSGETLEKRRGSVLLMPCRLSGRFAFTGSYRYSGLSL